MLSCIRGTKLRALDESVDCGLEHSLQMSAQTLSFKNINIYIVNGNQPNPAQNTTPSFWIHFHNIVNLVSNIMLVYGTNSLFRLQIIGNQFSDQLIEFRFYIVLGLYALNYSNNHLAYILLRLTLKNNFW